MKIINLINRKFGKLRVSQFLRVEKCYGSTRCIWECQCDCGNIITINTARLTSGNVKSCGCLRRDCGKKNVKNINGRKKELGFAAKNVLYNQYKQSAKCRKINFNLSHIDFIKICEQNCHYCGIEPKQTVKIGKNRNMNGNFIHNGIDRIDNTIGYQLNNCVGCCKMCNIAKWKHNYVDFIQWIKKIAKHQQ